jgi:2-polyprenyl-3-methyl-5-hydroxy-6-metoxy-1,4-benzoquinol methylase
MIDYYNGLTNRIFKKNSVSYFEGPTKIPIIKKIPRFIKSKINYAEMWGTQWAIYPRTQFDSFTKTNYSKKRLEYILGCSIKNLKNKNILEVGAGAGRFTEILLKCGANVHSIDASQAVECNYKNNKKISNKFKIAQADLYNIPYKDNSFDYVVCIGVLQHIPCSLEGLRSIWSKVKKNGILIVDHYQFTIGYYFSFLPIIRFFLKMLPTKYTIKITKLFVKSFFPILWAVRDNEKLFVFLRRIFPLGFNYSIKKDLTKKQHYQWTELDTHDALTDPYKRCLTKKSFSKMLNELGGKIELLSSLRPGGNGLEARIKKK